MNDGRREQEREKRGVTERRPLVRAALGLEFELNDIGRLKIIRRTLLCPILSFVLTIPSLSLTLAHRQKPEPPHR